ncbi:MULTISPECIES: hypothetical protein [Flavobacteriaceae]|uniref:hypothetical protein n=1 Tax=Flavobacteriaceae TaxID=49546 RepID=UPI0010AE3874|nr:MULTISPECIES: hypothetical protein [Flavobacteriaceae]NJB36190.1 hypothetical protein [Croceivirga sp. JEA036]TKD66674.1 hypothetical protein FBT53_02115 [Flavobacterium sp. ASW18X]
MVQTKTEIQLVDGTFTVSEATDLLVALLEEKINFHKLHRLSLGERYPDSDTDYDDNRIHQLMQERTRVKKLYQEIDNPSAKIKIEGILNISLED